MTPNWAVMCTIARDADGERGSRLVLLRSSKDVNPKTQFKIIDDNADENCWIVELCNFGNEVD